HCYSCHNDEKKEGELNLAKVKNHQQATQRVDFWEQVVKRVAAKEMPPEDSPPLSDADREKLIAWVKSLPKPDNCDKLATDETQSFYKGHVMSRRLNKAEYNNSLRDLLGIDLKPADRFPADGSGGEGFDTSGDALFTSAILMEKYLEASSHVLTTILPDRPGETLPPEIIAARERLLIAAPSDKLAPREAARQIVRPFAHKAFRRPIQDDEVERYLSLFDRATARGDRFEAAVRLALQAVLVSPNFLFLVEPEPASEGIYRLGGYPLASRLSYFLWSSLPDDELLKMADSGELLKPEVLKQQVQRMLRDPRSKALGENFGSQWLGIGALGGTIKPDTGKFPEFDAELAQAMRDETAYFVHAVFQENRPLTELLDADYTFVNQRLAKHYGLSDIQGSEMRRVSLSDRARGGVATQASVLTVTSYPLRTSPVLRGRFVLEELLGSRVPPPPPNVPALPTDDAPQDGLTLRQRLELHRTNAECASCHNRMDPLGFGLENFDPIGRWRKELAGAPIDASGKLPSGEAFDGPEQLKSLLIKRKPEILKHLSKKMLGYALGRELNRFDQCVLDDAMKALAANEYKSQVLIEQIVLSYPFQHRYVKK
ncbi:MAG TPA: DUF1592 domain-containing protein, partial [Pirellulaceae bacterium]|nr:DUF1592 domain-containing protein [Pirellulaceae bacterium]